MIPHSLSYDFIANTSAYTQTDPVFSIKPWPEQYATKDVDTNGKYAQPEQPADFSDATTTDTPKKYVQTYEPQFRPGHNLSLLLSEEMTIWNLKQNQTNVSTDEQVNSVSHAKSNITGLYMRYTYDVNISGGFGFFLGSSVGIASDQGHYGNEKQFYPGYSVAFPSALGGFIENITFTWRIFTGAEYGSDWFPRMSVTSTSQKAAQLTPVANMFNFFAGTDIFLDSHTAATFVFGTRRVETICLNNCDSTMYFNSFSITNSGVYSQVGFTWSMTSIN